MRFVIFTHSLVSDWNHGNAHFLRGIATELILRGHDVEIFEPAEGWSRSNLIRECGFRAIADFQEAYPLLKSYLYSEDTLNTGRVLDGADVVIVHEWNSHQLVRAIGEHHKTHGGYSLYFHDTHHRAATQPESMGAYNLRNFDAVLAYGNCIRDLYLANGWTREAMTWHEAADTRVFQPQLCNGKEGDLVWIGNWGDDERTAELREFLIRPVRELGLKAKVFGVRYPAPACAELEDAGIEYGGWLPNYRVPEVFAKYRVTVHVPRRPYACALPGIPTIRPFEALACGIPLVSAPWNDSEQLFRAGRDFLYAEDGHAMMRRLDSVLSDEDLRDSLIANGLETIRLRHTCSHRVDELLHHQQQRRTVAVQGAAN